MSANDFDNMSGKGSDRGYERDESRWAEDESNSSNDGKKKRKGEHQYYAIARKRRPAAQERVKSMTDSGYERDISSDADARLFKSDREEETQVLPFSLGGYVDHSRDPDDGRTAFAPIHRKPNFTESLFAILSNPDLASIIQWMPHGRSFVILKRDEFAKDVLPVYFRHSNLSSFNRQLNGMSIYALLMSRCGCSITSLTFNAFRVRVRLSKDQTRCLREVVLPSSIPS